MFAAWIQTSSTPLTGILDGFFLDRYSNPQKAHSDRKDSDEKGFSSDCKGLSDKRTLFQSSGFEALNRVGDSKKKGAGGHFLTNG